MKSVSIYTLGCKVNTYESEFIKELLKNAKYEIKSFDEVCDIYIINTCSVTNTSDIKSRKIINNAINKNKDAVIVAMGCFIEANHDYKEDGLDIIIGNKDKSKIVEILEEYYKDNKEIRHIKNIDSSFEDMYISNFTNKTRAFVKIQDGCENFCTYCIIPYVRGKCRSKEFNKVIEEITLLVNNDYKEIVLTGIHTGNYGVDINTDFTTLVKEILKISNLQRLRISSIEITELNDELISIITNNKIIADHLHIPIQAGSNEVLKLMNRKYTLEEYKNIINKIRKSNPSISISTDLIVGFPSETEEMFLKTIDTVRELEFSKIHVFPYSKRKNTKALDIPNHNSDTVIKERSRRLNKVSKELELNYFNKQINTKVDVLIETSTDSYSIGHSSNYLSVKVLEKLEKNKIYKVEINKIDYPFCIGKVVK